MIKSTIIPLALLFAASAQAECVSDSWEIGDSGPGPARVCEALEAQFLTAKLAVVNRKIHSADAVSVMVTVDGEPRSLNYRLIGADWILETAEIASNQR